MNNTEKIKLLPKIEVSFQDDFSNDEDHVVRTPVYVLEKLRERGIDPKVGDKILFFEQDVNEKDQDYYICVVGKIILANEDMLKPFSFEKILLSELATIDGKPVIIEINDEEYCDLPINSDFFSDSNLIIFKEFSRMVEPRNREEVERSLSSVFRLALILLFGGVAYILEAYWHGIKYNQKFFFINWAAPIFGIYFLYRYLKYKKQLKNGIMRLEGLKVNKITKIRKIIEVTVLSISIILTFVFLVLIMKL